VGGTEGRPNNGSIYSVHPAIAYEESSMRNLYRNTGRTLAEWVQLVVAEGPATEKERAVWLKAHHGLGTNTAGWIAERAEGKGPEYHPEALVQAQYTGSALVGTWAATPCKTFVPLRRRHGFAHRIPIASLAEITA